MQVGIFVAMFLSVGQVPLDVMEGWLHTVARLNPMTNMLRMARQGFVGEITWHDTWPGLLVTARSGRPAFGAWAYAGLQQANEGLAGRRSFWVLDPVCRDLPRPEQRARSGTGSGLWWSSPERVLLPAASSGRGGRTRERGARGTRRCR